MNRFQNISKKKLIGAVAIIVLMVAIGLTVFIAQQQQEVRQRAAGEEVELFFSNGNTCGTPLTSLQISQGQQLAISLCMNAARPVNAFDIKLILGNALQAGSISNISEGGAAQTLTSEFAKSFDASTGTLHLAKGDNDKTIQGTNLLLATTNVTVNQPGSGVINFTPDDVLVTTPNSSTALSVALPALSYSPAAATTAPTTTASTSCPTITWNLPTEFTANTPFTLTPTFTGGSTQYSTLLVDGQPLDPTANNTWTLNLTPTSHTLEYVIRDNRFYPNNGFPQFGTSCGTTTINALACNTTIQIVGTDQPITGNDMTVRISGIGGNPKAYRTMYEFAGNAGVTPGRKTIRPTFTNNWGGGDGTTDTWTKIKAQPGPHTLQIATEAYIGNAESSTPYFCSGTVTYTGVAAATSTPIPTSVPTQPSAACAPSATTATTGQAITWTATGQTGGDGSYTYGWSGIDATGQTGGTPSISATYTTAGTKNMTMRINSAGQFKDVACTGTVTVSAPITQPSATCAPSTTTATTGQAITWTAAGQTGGDGTYTYSWSGTDVNPTAGSPLPVTYTTTGAKIMHMRITSAGQFKDIDCTGTVTVSAPAILCERKAGGYPLTCQYVAATNDNDFRHWADRVGRPSIADYITADYDGNGIVNIADFNRWRSRKYGL